MTIRITMNGSTLNKTQWCHRLGISHAALNQRLSRWPLAKALTTPRQLTGNAHKYIRRRRQYKPDAAGDYECVRCNIYQPPANYHRDTTSKNLLCGTCRRCRKQQHVTYRNNRSPEQMASYRRYQAAYQRQNSHKYRPRKKPCPIHSQSTMSAPSLTAADGPTTRL